jgi:hypothetical protein
MKEAMESLGRVRVQGILLLAIAFVIGGIAGVLVDRANPMRDRRPRMDRSDRRFERPGEFPGFFEKLDLTDEQRGKIHAIFEAHRPVIDSLMAETMPRIRAQRDSAAAEISLVLTPEQRERFEKLSPRHRLPMREWGHPFDSGDGGRGRGGPPARDR